jgi:hypothetical protein
MPTWPTATLRRLLGVLIFYALCGCFLLSLAQAYRWLEAVTGWPSIFTCYSLLPLAWLGSRQLWDLRNDYGIAVGHHPHSPSARGSVLRDSMRNWQRPHTVPFSLQSWSPSLDAQGTVTYCPHCSQTFMIVTHTSTQPSLQHPRPHGWPRA